MTDTIRWCFTHSANELPTLKRFCTYGWSDTSQKCDIWDAVPIRLPIDYEAAMEVLWDLGLVDTTDKHVVKDTVDAALRWVGGGDA